MEDTTVQGGISRNALRKLSTRIPLCQVEGIQQQVQSPVDGQRHKRCGIRNGERKSCVR